jgi:hypothetical protein
MPAPRFHGSCRVLYGVDIARGIDLVLAQASMLRAHRTEFQHKSRATMGSGMSRPLRLSWEAAPESLDGYSTSPDVQVAIYELGTVCITWTVEVDGALEELVQLSAGLYEHAGLIARSRELAAEVIGALGAALDRPQLSSQVEDYVVFEVAPVDGGPSVLLRDSRRSLAQLLRAESGGLSTQEVEDALMHPVSYGDVDVCLVDWLAAFLMGSDTEDERHVLELATVELLELRLLDAQLDREIEEAYELLASPRGLWGALTVQRRELERIARMQADDALLHEGIDNALKLFGDDYLARLYRTSAERFHFDDWDRSIQRKLEVLRSIYQSMADLASHHRSEVLEWIIILLIAADIALYFTPLR